MEPAHFSVGVEPDPLFPIFRRFLHRFPQVTVLLEFLDAAWFDAEELRAVQTRYVGWARVEMLSSETGEAIGVPLSPHASDDDEGSDVEDLTEPPKAP